MARPEKIRLGDLLIQQGLLTDEQLKFALDEQKRSGRKLGRIVVESSFVTEEAISKALARQLQVSYVDLKHFNPKQNLINLLPEAQARRFRAVVLDEVNGRLQVGFVDPTDLQAYDDILRLLHRDLELAVVAESQLLALIDRVYRRTEEISGLAKELTADLGDVPVEFGDLLGNATGADEAPVVKLLQTVFEEAMRSRASDIHIEPQDRTLRVRFRIDGVLHVQMEADGKIAPALALRLKLMSGLDISEKRLPQDGRFAIKVRNNMIDVRISTMPTQYGESVVMRLLNQNTGLLGLDRLNMPPRTLERLRHAVRRPSGMVLVTGPTGSGKTTTLYAALSELNTTEKKIITVEDPVEYRLPGINQVQVHEKIDLSFERVLRSALRQDPDIVLVGEMRDQTTAEIGMRAAITGHMVLSTLHTNDAPSTLTRLMNMGIPTFNIASSILLITAQRLVRRLCTCKKPLDTPIETLLNAGFTEDDMDGSWTLYGPGQCDRCKGSGYKGRVGLYQVMPVTEAIQRLIMANGTALDIAVQAQREGVNDLRRSGLLKVKQGLTSLDEILGSTNA